MGQEKNRAPSSQPDYELIDSAAQLTAFARQAQTASMLAVDLEADSMFHYREKVCLLQMAANGSTVVIDPLKVPKTGQAMLAAGFSEEQTERVLFLNPIEYYAQSGRISLDDVAPPAIDQTQLWEDNSVLRGQTPVVR